MNKENTKIIYLNCSSQQQKDEIDAKNRKIKTVVEKHQHLLRNNSFHFSHTHVHSDCLPFLNAIKDELGGTIVDERKKGLGYFLELEK